MGLLSYFSSAPAKEEPKAETTVETKTETTEQAPASTATPAQTLSAIAAANENAKSFVEQKKEEAVPAPTVQETPKAEAKVEISAATPVPAQAASSSWSLNPITWLFGSSTTAPQASQSNVKVEPTPVAKTEVIAEIAPVTQEAKAEVTPTPEAPKEEVKTEVAPPTKLKVNYLELVTADFGKNRITRLINETIQNQIKNGEPQSSKESLRKEIIQRRDELKAEQIANEKAKVAEASNERH
jgi:hypothetical protein